MSQQPSNPAALASLACGVGAWLCSFLSFCSSFVPFVGGAFGAMVWSAAWLAAFLGIVLGLVGYREAMVRDGVGRGGALAGLALSGSWVIVQVLLMLVLLASIVGLFSLIGLAIALDGAR